MRGRLAEAHAVFRRWLGEEYDLGALDAMLCALVAERLDGDPPWIMVVSGSGNAKTETVQAAVGAGALLTGTLTSAGSLLSATPRKERAGDATGGLLRRIGGRGVLVIKDATSILSMDRRARADVLHGLRETHDGRWDREVGSEGGRVLTWAGRIVVVGAVTSAWDRAYDVISELGDRFVLVRMDSHRGRPAARRQAVKNTGSEEAMRKELAGVVGATVAAADLAAARALTDAESDRLGEAADLVTLARTAVEYDYRGDVIDADAPEMPTRLTKELAQLVRGGLALGMTPGTAVRLAVRCARDSMPPLRLALIDDVAANPDSTPADVQRRLDKPRTTVRRQLESLHLLGVLTCTEVETGSYTRSLYSLANGIHPEVIRN